MPLYRTLTIDTDTVAYLWKVEEDEAWLADGIELTEPCRQRMSQMKSGLHRRAFLSIRHLMAEAGYQDSDLYYDEIGKPDGFVYEEIGECLVAQKKVEEAKPYFKKAHALLIKFKWVAEDTKRVERMKRLAGE